MDQENDKNEIDNLYDDWQKEVLAGCGKVLYGMTTGSVTSIASGLGKLVKGFADGIKNSDDDSNNDYNDWMHGAWD